MRLHAALAALHAGPRRGESHARHCGQPHRHGGRAPCPENGGQRSELCFYGSSFLTDETGALLQCAPRDAEAVLLQTYDLDALLESRSSWGLFRDRRPEYYGAITHRAQDSLTR